MKIIHLVALAALFGILTLPTTATIEGSSYYSKHGSSPFVWSGPPVAVFDLGLHVGIVGNLFKLQFQMKNYFTFNSILCGNHN